jgi:membrane dipeptidase
MNDAPLASSPSIDAAALHASLLTLDSHIDVPWPDTPDPNIDGPRRVDLPKMKRGGLWAGCFAAYIPQGPRDEAGYAAALARVGAMLDAIGAMAAKAPADIPVSLAETEADTRAARAAGRIAIIRAIENGYPLGTDLSHLAGWRARGVRYLTLVHNGHNQLADSANPRPDLGDAATLNGGLSPLGRDAIREMNRLGIAVDISHLSRQAMMQAVQHSQHPVVATHSCAAALCPHPRNLDDMQIDALRDTGGLVQITAMGAFLRPRGKGDATVRDFVDHLDHVVARAGVAHVGISSDFDGGGGIDGWRDASESANITAELVRRGYGRAEIEAFWGGNFLRVLESGTTVEQGK